MEDFVSNLIKTSDLSVLTTKAVRKAYEAHIKQSLSKDEKDKLKQFVSGLLDEIAETLKVPFPAVPAEVQTSTKTPQSNPQQQKAADNVEKTSPIETLPSNPLAQKPDISDKTVPNSVSNGVQNKLTSAKADASREDLNSPQKLKSSKRNGSNDKSSTEPDDQKDEETEQPKKIVKKHNGKLKSKLDNEKNESSVSADNETPTRTTSRRRNKKVNYVESDNESESESVEMVSPRKPKLSIDPKTKSTEVSNANDSESDLPSIHEKQDSSEESFVEEISISKPVKSLKKKIQKKKSPKKKAPVKRKKKMSLDDAVDNVLESEKDMVSSPLSSIDIASTVSSDTELVDQTRKRKHVSSDEDLELVIDEDLSPLQTKKTKRKTASVKPAAKRKKLVTKSEEIDSDDPDELLNNSNGKQVPGEKGKVSALEDLSDDEPVSKSKKSVKLSNKKKKKILEEINSEEDDKPLKSAKNAKTARKTTKRKAAAKKFKIPDEGLESDSDNEPVRPKWKPTAKASPIPKKKTALAEISDSDNVGDVEPDEEPLKPIKKRIWAAPAKKSVNDDSDIDEPLKPKPKPSAKASPVPKAKMDKDAEDGSFADESPLKSKRNKVKKQIVESDSDGGFSESEEEPLKPAKGKKKKSPKRKPKKAKAKVLEKSLNNSDNEHSKLEPEKKPLILKIKKSDIKTVSESDEEPIVLPNSSLKVGVKKNGFDSGSEGSDEDSLHIDLGASEPEDQANSEVSENGQTKKTASGLDSDDSGTSMDIDSPGPLKKKGKKKTTLTKDQNKLADLRKICRSVGIILRNKIELLGCDTDQQKISRIKEILRNRGMKGEPSMDKVKLLNLKKEAAELNTDNIISDSGRSKRKVKSRFGRGDNSPSLSPKKTVTPLKLKLSALRGVIDSEGSESD